MAILCCNNRNNCIYNSVVASIIVGIIAAMLNFLAIITVTPAFLWTLFGIAIVYLALTPVIAILARSGEARGCVRSVIGTLLTGILGTILTAVLLLGIEFAATSIIGTIIIGALLAFFTLTLTSVACLAKCIAGSFSN